MSIHDLIATAGDRLTPTDRRIARAVIENPTLLAFGTVSDLAEHVGTSRPSIVRFATKLGFDGYADLQAQQRDQVSNQLSKPIHRIRQHQETGPLRRSLHESIDAVFDSLTDERLDTLVRPMVDAPRVWVLSGETSLAGAHKLYTGLSILHSDVRLVTEHSLGRDLVGAGAGEAAVVFDFSRYRRYSITAARSLADLGVKILAITDGPLSPLARISHAWGHLKIPALGPFDSSVPAVVAAELIVARAAVLLGDDARGRIDRLEALWQSTGTFIEDVNGHPPSSAE
jgi:DNA-binding MurR/RpiR family transcriptional regulator